METFFIANKDFSKGGNATYNLSYKIIVLYGAWSSRLALPHEIALVVATVVAVAVVVVVVAVAVLVARVVAVAEAVSEALAAAPAESD